MKLAMVTPMGGGGVDATDESSERNGRNKLTGRIHKYGQTRANPVAEARSCGAPVAMKRQAKKSAKRIAPDVQKYFDTSAPCIPTKARPAAA